MSWLREGLPLGATVAVLAVVVVLVRVLLAHPERRFVRGLTLAVVWLVGAVAVVLALPVEESMRGNLLSLLGVLLSATIALGATTFVSQALGGVMLKLARNFRSGDFIQVGEHFGRVTVRGLFHTEIQVRTRDLVTLPNLYLATSPVRVVQRTGTIVTADVGLGYDAPTDEVEKLLAEAAAEVGLEEPFVLVEGLGSFAVTYRVGGLLVDAKQLISTQSRLRRTILSRLHGAGIEIASPTLMSTRAFDSEHKFLYRPARGTTEATPPEGSSEAIAFDKADQAESLEDARTRVEKLKKELSEATSEEKVQIRAQLEGAQKRVEAMTARLEEAQEEDRS